MKMSDYSRDIDGAWEAGFRDGKAEAADEMLLMGLRLVEGVDLERLAGIGGVAPSEGAIAELVDLGLLARPAPGRIAATGDGRFILNELVLRLSRSFVPASPSPAP